MNCDNEFVNQNMGLVVSIAKRFIGRGTDYEDLIQIGLMGLVKAANRYDESLGYKFSTYAVPVIMGEIKKHLRDDNYIKISRKLKENLTKVNMARQQLQNEKGRSPILTEIAEKTNLSEEEIIECIDFDLSVASFDTGIENILREEGEEENVLDKIFLKELLERLDERSKKIITLRYFKNKTQQETSNIVGVSQVQISRLEKKILNNLKDMCI